MGNQQHDWKGQVFFTDREWIFIRETDLKVIENVLRKKGDVLKWNGGLYSRQRLRDIHRQAVPVVRSGGAFVLK